LLLGIGQNVDAVRLTNNTDNTIENTPIEEGAKISLFDVSDIDAPIEINYIVYANGYTPVEYDYRALTVLAMENGSYRFALPIERWLSESTVDENQQQIDIWYPEHELALVEVTSSTNQGQLLNVGKIKIAQDLNNIDYSSGWDDRALFHFDDIYYIHGRHVWQSNWVSVDDVEGPF